jgi:hypothetical protein
MADRRRDLAQWLARLVERFGHRRGGDVSPVCAGLIGPGDYAAASFRSDGVGDDGPREFELAVQAHKLSAADPFADPQLSGVESPRRCEQISSHINKIS